MVFTLYLKCYAHSMVSEELLIDFRELVGEHSGENLAHAVYDMLKVYGLQGRISP